MSEAEAVRILKPIAAALDYAHSKGVVHRDVKPGNVLFVRGAPVLADAGLVVDDREAASLVGTPGYEPPEHHGAPQGDIFSLGRTLWRIGTGRAPEEAGFAPCAEADTSDPDFWRFLAIVGKATSPVPERRYRSAKALRKELSGLRRRRAVARRRHIRALLWIAVLPILVPAVWNFSTFRAILTVDESMRALIVWPFPYRMLKPLFVSRNPPPPPWQQAAYRKKTLSSSMQAVDNANETLRGVLSDLPDQRDKRRKP